MSRPHTYPPGHPKEGKVTTKLVNVWQCPLCNYTSNLVDDIEEHKRTCPKRRKA